RGGDILSPLALHRIPRRAGASHLPGGASGLGDLLLPSSVAVGTASGPGLGDVFLPSPDRADLAELLPAWRKSAGPPPGWADCGPESGIDRRGVVVGRQPN